MKVSNQELEVLVKRATSDSSVKLEELRVLMNWLTDSDEYSACVSILNERLPMMTQPNIRRALKNLEAKGYIASDGYGFYKNTDGDLIRYKKYCISKESPQKPKESPETSSVESKESPQSPIPPKIKDLLTLPSNRSSNEKREVKMEVLLKETKLVPEYNVPYSEWRCHYLKSSSYEAKFDKLSELEKEVCYMTKDKDEFITLVDKKYNQSFPNVSQDVEVEL